MTSEQVALESQVHKSILNRETVQPGDFRGVTGDWISMAATTSVRAGFGISSGSRAITMDAGFYLFDEETRAARFFAVGESRQVHDVMAIDRP